MINNCEIILLWRYLSLIYTHARINSWKFHKYIGFNYRQMGLTYQIMLPILNIHVSVNQKYEKCISHIKFMPREVEVYYIRLLHERKWRRRWKWYRLLCTIVFTRKLCNKTPLKRWRLIERNDPLKDQQRHWLWHVNRVLK